MCFESCEVVFCDLWRREKKLQYSTLIGIGNVASGTGEGGAKGGQMPFLLLVGEPFGKFVNLYLSGYCKEHQK
jgi:hypothetical protein